MCLCYLFSAKTAWQLMNRKADLKKTDSNRFESRIGMLYWWLHRAAFDTDWRSSELIVCEA